MHSTSLFHLPNITRPTHAFVATAFNCLNDGKLRGRNVESVDVGRQAGEGLLCAVWSDEGVDLDAVDVVLLLESRGNLALVGLDVDDEDERVVLLNLSDTVSLLSTSMSEHYVVPSSWRTRC
jgi:hypothetical protein